MTERKRYLSKSREAIFEKVAQSNLKKSLSRSRERLCDIRLTLSKSRELLNSQQQQGAAGGAGGGGGDVKNFSRAQDKFPNFRSVSKSQEVLNAALGGAPMKRMVNGAVSDISHALMASSSSSSSSSGDPSAVEHLLASSEMLRLNFESLHLLPISESAPTSVSSSAQDLLLSPTREVASSIVDEPLVEAPEEVEKAEERKHSESKEGEGEEEDKALTVAAKQTKPTMTSIGVQVELIKPEPIGALLNSIEPAPQKKAVEVATQAAVGGCEQDEEGNAKILVAQPRQDKEIAPNQSSAELEKEGESKENAPCESSAEPKESDAEVDQHVDEEKPHKEAIIAKNHPEFRVGKAHDEATPGEETAPPQETSMAGKVSEEPDLPDDPDKPDDTDQGIYFNANHETSNETAPCDSGSSSSSNSSNSNTNSKRAEKGFSHTSTLGEKSTRKDSAWEKELSKIPMRKKVAQLIGTFDKSEEQQDEKQKRRGSLNIDVELNKDDEEKRRSLEEAREERMLRRKSTSAILFNPHSEMNILNLTNILIRPSSKEELAPTKEDEDSAEEGAKEENSENKEEPKESTAPEESPKEAEESSDQAPATPSRRRRNWDYFEIDHPKAISDRKLQQLKEKYLRRKTEAFLTNNTIREEAEEVEQDQDVKKKATMVRSNSMPVAAQGLTTTAGKDESVAAKTEHSKESKLTVARAAEPGRRRMSSCSSNNLEDIEEASAEETKAEEAHESNGKKLTVDIHSRPSEDDGIGSLPQTPTDLMIMQNSSTSVGEEEEEDKKAKASLDDGICTSSEEALPENQPSSQQQQQQQRQQQEQNAPATTKTDINSNHPQKNLLLLQRRASSVEVDGCLTRRIEALMQPVRARSVEADDPQLRSMKMKRGSVGSAGSFVRAMEKFKRTESVEKKMEEDGQEKEEKVGGSERTSSASKD